jgi:predicted enzyme related to lactoylglutathione lyase
VAERDGYDPGTPSWVDLTTPDLEDALRFYGGVFGWEFEDAHAAAIADAGGTVMFGPLEVTGQGRMLIAVDPEGARFGIWEPQAHTGAQLVNENGALTFSQLASRNLDGAARFLGSVFPYTFEALPGMPFDAYRAFAVGERVVGGMIAMPADVPAEAPPHWLTYFWLDDVDAGARRVRELGGEVVRGPEDSASGRSATLRDPQGGLFAVIRGVN